MLNNARRANPLVPWRTVWLALALIGLPGVIAMVVILSSTASTTPNGDHRAAVGPAVAVLEGSAACAKTSRDAVHSTRPGAASEVVPPGATAVLLCRYGPRGNRLVVRSITAVATVRRLARELNALPPAKGAYSCPLDNGESIVADFAYAHGPENPVSVGLSGCATVSNGHGHRIAAGTQLVRRVKALIPARRG